MSFKNYEKNIQSQFGEDGVIEEIFKRIGNRNKICVEFGAWDGIHLSNAWNLWHNEDWEALLIEGDKEKYQILVDNTRNFKRVRPHLAYVSFEGKNSIESILKRLNFPKDIDLLSIDIDSDDYYVFKSLNYYRPRVVLVEYNPTIPPNVEVVQELGEYIGSSALAIFRVGKEKGYKLIHMTETNMFFVDGTEFDKLNIEEPALNDLFIADHLTYLISSYDGKTLLAGNATYCTFDNVESEFEHPKVISQNPLRKVVVYNSTTNKDSVVKKLLKKLK